MKGGIGFNFSRTLPLTFEERGGGGGYDVNGVMIYPPPLLYSDVFDV